MYTVVVHGIPIQCESAAEAVELARQAGEGGTAPASNIHDRTPSLESRWTEPRITEFFELIQGNQRKLIDSLRHTGDGRTDVQLRQLLGFSDNRALGGVFAGLHKNAKKTGADPEDLSERDTVTIGDAQYYEYKLTETFRDAAKRWGPS